ncbi:MAG TPA: DUF167 domain-containing protein [Candidatus Anoxymicrobiaceae bacterium]|jgi:uncharacterized protein
MPGDETLRVKVTTRSSRPRVEQEDDGGYRVYVSTAPEKGKANTQVLKALARHLGVPRSALEITGGLTSRDKTIRLTL